MLSPSAVEIEYVNWRGEQGTRRIQPVAFRFGEVEWHQGPQWLLDAIDLDKEAMRTFALSGVTSWKPLSTPATGATQS